MVTLWDQGDQLYLFKKIQDNEKLKITDEKMTRFMMTLDEAVNLVIFAFNNGSQGDIFIQKSPATNILTLRHCAKLTFNLTMK